MFGGLYGDLPAAKDEAKDGIEAKEAKKDYSGFLDGNLHRPTSMAPPSLRRAAAVPVAVKASGGAQSSRKTIPKKTAVHAALRCNADDGPPVPRSNETEARDLASSFGDGIADEYDPLKPNDYEHVRKQREQDRLLAEAEAEKQERLRELRELREADSQQRRGGDFDYDVNLVSDDSKRSAALRVSGEEAFLRRGGLRLVESNSEGMTDGVQGDETNGDGRTSVKGMSLAQRMMEKMGWKAGQGLGKNQQGMAQPLEVQKTDVRSGKIVKPTPNTLSTLPRQHSNDSTSRVLLIRNAVGPGEVDESLDEEIGVECSKYGEVLDVLIFEVIEPGFPPEEAVRIFVQFEEAGAATRALSELRGRYFGGRTLMVELFDEERFEKRELAPDL